MRGENPTTSNLMAVKQKINKGMLAQDFRNRSMKDTIDQVNTFAHHRPTLLKELYDELQESLDDDHETQRNAIREFEQRKLDYKYFCMIEERERSNFNKQFRKRED